MAPIKVLMTRFLIVNARIVGLFMKQDYIGIYIDSEIFYKNIFTKLLVLFTMSFCFS